MGICITTRKKPEKYYRVSRNFDAVVGKIPHETAAKPLGVVDSVVT